MNDQKLKDHYEAADGLSVLHLLSYEPDTDTVIYEERIPAPAAVGAEATVLEPRTTTAQLWLEMTGGTAT